MTSSQDAASRAIGPGVSALLGAALILGWSGFDLAKFATSGHPPTALLLLPAILAAVLLGALAGGLLSAHRTLPLAAVLLAGLAVAATLLRAEYMAPHHNHLVRVIFLLLLLHALGALLHRRWGFSALRAGLALGFLSSLLVAYSQDVPVGIPGVIYCLACALTLGSGFLAHTGARRGLTLLAAASIIWATAYNAHILPAGRRADVAPAPQLSAEERPAGAPNLVLIVIDTLRADHVSCYGYERETTPNLDAFASSVATRYTNARSTSSWTLPAHASLMTGQYPGQHGATTTRRVPGAEVQSSPWQPAQPVAESSTMLAEVLDRRGYHTGAAVGNMFNVGAKLGFGRGFHHFDDHHGSYTRHHRALVQLAGYRPALGSLAYRDASMITDSALSWLDGIGRDEPFFLFLNYMDPHDPYIPHRAVQEAFSDDQPRNPWVLSAEDVTLQYDREILFTDQNVGRLLDALRARGDFEDSLIIITSDHGEGLGEHGNDFHSWTLYDELLRIPLLVKPAGARSAKVDTIPLDLTDVHDLMRRELGLEPADSEPATHLAEWYRGSPGMAGEKRDAVTAREQRMGQALDRSVIAWLEGSTKYIVGTNGHVEAYDLERDPREAMPLELTEPQLAAARARATVWWEAHPPPAPVQIELTEDDTDRLKLLGYIDDIDED